MSLFEASLRNIDLGMSTCAARSQEVPPSVQSQPSRVNRIAEPGVF